MGIPISNKMDFKIKNPARDINNPQNGSYFLIFKKYFYYFKISKIFLIFF